MLYFFLLIGIAITILMSTFFSLSETAILSINRYRLSFLIKKGGKAASYLRHIIDNPEKILSPILLGNTLSNVATATLTSYLVSLVFINKIGFINNEMAQVFASILVTILILVFGEITPKSIAARYPETFALKVVFPLRVIAMILSPLVKIAILGSRGMIKLLSSRQYTADLDTLSVDELKSIITYHSNLPISKETQAMLYSILDFPSVPVKEIMIARRQAVMLPLETSFEEVVKCFLKKDVSVIPVYSRSWDNVVGVLDRRNLFTFLALGKKTSIEKAMTPPVFVPETASIATVLSRLKNNKQTFALLVDEFGQFEGIVTIESIVEKVLGETQKLAQDQGGPVVKIDDSNYLIDGFFTIREFNRIFIHNLPISEHYSTLAGFMMDKLGRIPKLRDSFEWKKFRFTVMETEGHQIKRIWLQLNSKQIKGEHEK